MSPHRALDIRTQRPPQGLRQHRIIALKYAVIFAGSSYLHLQPFGI